MTTLPNRQSLAVLMLSALTLHAAHAMEGVPPTALAPPAFQLADVNGDQLVHLEEFQAQGGMVVFFKAADANADQRLDRVEYSQLSHRADYVAINNFIADTVITAKVKALLSLNDAFSPFDVSVETLGGQVLLSGSVDKAEQIKQVASVAGRVRGVKTIRNDLRVKG